MSRFFCARCERETKLHRQLCIITVLGTLHFCTNVCKNEHLQQERIKEWRKHHELWVAKGGE